MTGIDGSVPSYPSVEGGRVWYTQLVSECYVNTISVERFDSTTGRLSSSASARRVTYSSSSRRWWRRRMKSPNIGAV